ncbi:AMP-binding protein [Pseudomarimonas arenosa]|uniref:AMP-binding protein n=1 Tax=Pseudomarimonas arenosa TaxID=2774145 RepID=A0AAW3ZN27_9GAMM|nr:AMP-binding protein [Pseudomarimonas arenosa]MBD8526602.1 AMP-binding protein [Pseudomarimonas arenosa]
MSALWKALASALSQPACRLSDSHASIRGADLLAAIERIADRLLGLGVRRAASRLDNGLAWLNFEFALQSLGCLHVPLPTYFSPEQVGHALDLVGVDALLLPAGVAPAGAAWRPLSDWPLAATGLWLREPRSTPLPSGARLVTFTSGTTAQPKGVCLEDELLLRVALSLGEASAAARVERHVSVLPLATLLEQVGVMAALLAGASVHLPSLSQLGYSGASGLDAKRFLHTIAVARGHSLILVPQLLEGLICELEAGFELAQPLRFVAVGGAQVAADLHQRAETLGLPVFEGYGLSECGSVVALNRPGSNRPGSVGLPLPHLRLRIDPNGELQVAGARMLGYVGSTSGDDDALDSEWLSTGDLVRFDDDGYLYIAGRRKHQFITAYGRNVNPEWPEAALTAQPSIAQAFVHGEARPFNVAVLVPRGSDRSDAELQAALDQVNASLPDYARISRWLRAEQPFAIANGLATANGRLRREAILARHQDAIELLYAASPNPYRSAGREMGLAV